MYNGAQVGSMNLGGASSGWGLAPGNGMEQHDSNGLPPLDGGMSVAGGWGMPTATDQHQMYTGGSIGGFPGHTVLMSKTPYASAIFPMLGATYDVSEVHHEGTIFWVHEMQQSNGFA